MKCEICGHKILPGQKECMNCGYKLVKEIPNTFGGDARDHSHIRLEKRVRKNNNYENINKNIRKLQDNKNIGKGIVVFLLVIFMFFGLIGSFISSFFDDYEGKTFENIILEELDDDYNTVQKAIVLRDKIMDYMDKKGIRGSSINETVREYGDAVEGRCDVEGYGNDDVYYSVTMCIREGNIDTLYLTASKDETDVLDTKFPIEGVEKFNELLGYDSIIDELKVIRQENIDDGFIDYEDDRVYIFEDTFDECRIQYSIAAKGYELDWQ